MEHSGKRHDFANGAHLKIAGIKCDPQPIVGGRNIAGGYRRRGHRPIQNSKMVLPAVYPGALTWDPYNRTSQRKVRKSVRLGPPPCPCPCSSGQRSWNRNGKRRRSTQGARPQHKWGRTPRFGCPPPLNYMWRLSAFSIPIIASVQSVGDQLKTPEALHAAVSPTSRVHRRTARLSRDRSRFLCTAGHP